MRIGSLVLAAALALGPVAAKAADFTTTLERDGRFDTFAEALRRSGAAETLGSLDTPFTVFAPTDEAFRRLPEGARRALFLDANASALEKVVALHVIVGGPHESDDIPVEMTSVSGARIVVTYTRGALTLRPAEPEETAAIDETLEARAANEGRIVFGDLAADDALIHALDAVLLPADLGPLEKPEGEITAEPAAGRTLAEAMRGVKNRAASGAAATGEASDGGATASGEDAAAEREARDGYVEAIAETDDDRGDEDLVRPADGAEGIAADASDGAADGDGTLYSTEVDEADGRGAQPLDLETVEEVESAAKRGETVMLVPADGDGEAVEDGALDDAEVVGRIVTLPPPEERQRERAMARAAPADASGEPDRRRTDGASRANADADADADGEPAQETFDLSTEVVSLADLLGRAVRDENGEELGEVSDVMLALDTARAESIVLALDSGLFGLFDESQEVEVDAISIDPLDGAVVVNRSALNRSE